MVILIVVGWCQSLCQSYQKLTESHQSGTGAQPELIDLCNVTISILIILANGHFHVNVMNIIL